MYPNQIPFAASQIVDGQQNLIFGTFEHPQGWQVNSQIIWNYQNSSQPATVYVGAYDPASGEGFEFLPTAGCYWLEPNYGFETIGQQKYGLTLMPPMSAPDALVKIVVTGIRGNRQNLRIIGAKPVPNLAQSVNAEELRSLPTEGVAVRIQYDEGGRTWEEDFYACRYQLPPNGGQLNWGLTRVFCFRAAQGTVDSKGPMFWRIASSLRQNPQWGQLFSQVAQSGNAQHRQFVAGEMNRHAQERIDQQRFSQYADWSANLQQQTFNERWASDQRHQAGMGEVLGGYTGYQDPNSNYGNIHQDYSNSQYVWTDGQGNWQYSNDPNFDPNIGADRYWYRANRQ
ncbi:hypothetical protein IAD21_02726 [Abditibacteriota bacterium]|nr:hypothetical protein IAD21_02726 [Abditibacteriota bacterium]